MPFRPLAALWRGLVRRVVSSGSAKLKSKDKHLALRAACFKPDSNMPQLGANNYPFALATHILVYTVPTVAQSRAL